MSEMREISLTKIIALLSSLLELFRQWRRGRKAEQAQERRDAIDEDSAQYMADRYGDGRVREYEPDADETGGSE